ncbi:MAG: sulfite exporter TauE/SafE family protein [Eubacteriales bacterium]|nr:sulfite exporter TauE/SafE family protein [Eubacteriales bacterium]
MLALVIALISGVILGMGMGGGTILIPALTLLCRTPLPVASGVNLLSFLPAAAVSCAVNLRSGLLDRTVAARFLLPGACGALAGAILSFLFDPKILKYGFYGFLLFISIQLLYKSTKNSN